MMSSGLEGRTELVIQPTISSGYLHNAVGIWDCRVIVHNGENPRHTDSHDQKHAAQEYAPLGTFVQHYQKEG